LVDQERAKEGREGGGRGRVWREGGGWQAYRHDVTRPLGWNTCTLDRVDI